MLADVSTVVSLIISIIALILTLKIKNDVKQIKTISTTSNNINAKNVIIKQGAGRGNIVQGNSK